MQIEHGTYVHGVCLRLTELIEFRRKKLLLIATNQRNSRKYSPSKVSRYTVVSNYYSFSYCIIHYTVQIIPTAEIMCTSCQSKQLNYRDYVVRYAVYTLLFTECVRYVTEAPAKL